MYKYPVLSEHMMLTSHQNLNLSAKLRKSCARYDILVFQRIDHNAYTQLRDHFGRNEHETSVETVHI